MVVDTEGVETRNECSRFYETASADRYDETKSLQSCARARLCESRCKSDWPIPGALLSALTKCGLYVLARSRT